MKDVIQVKVPYENSGNGELTVTLKWYPKMKRTETAPEEGGEFEVLNIEGFHYDDDIPDIENTAIAEAYLHFPNRE
jgi:hypothetical protein